MGKKIVQCDELTPNSCGLDLTWGWYCGEEKMKGKKFCQEHDKYKCYRNESDCEIVGTCSWASSLVCGTPYCKKHGCVMHGK